jgi:hypothetical protein
VDTSSFLKIPLQASPDQVDRLLSLQELFSQACNAISPIAQQNRCWNRVALHHLVYHKMRQQFEQLGSQMICNAVYSVCRIYRIAYESPDTPFGLAIREGTSLPLIKFLSNCPVYFDRHTLSIKGGILSLFTLNGRMRFHLNLDAQSLDQFKSQKLREIILTSEQDDFCLTFALAQLGAKVIDLQWPNYVVAIANDGSQLADSSNPVLSAREA